MNIFHKTLFAVCVGLGMMSAGAVLAQDANAGAISGSQSGVVANIQGAAGATSNNTFTSPSETEVRNVPAVSAPGVVTAHNCLQGYSAGASIVGGGISLGGTVVDKNCERISQAAALNTLVGADAAVLHMAGIPEVCKTLRAAGRIGAGSNCGDEDAGNVTYATRSASPRPAAKPAVIYTKCETRADGAILVGVKRGGDRGLAVSQCRAALGR